MDSCRPGRVERPDCVIVNRLGEDRGRLSAALENSGVEHIVYSSCNPISLWRRISRGCLPTRWPGRIFDMFPHTKHLEVAVLLQRR